MLADLITVILGGLVVLQVVDQDPEGLVVVPHPPRDQSFLLVQPRDSFEPGQEVGETEAT